MTKRHRTIGNVIWLPILENSFGTFCIEWNTSTHFNHHFCHLNPREMKCMSIQRLVNMNTHSSFIHNSQKLEGTKMSINRCVHGVNSVPIQWNTKPPARNTMDYGDMQQSEFPKRSVRRKEVRHKSVHPVSVHLCEILGKENRDNESIKTKADQWLPGVEGDRWMVRVIFRALQLFCRILWWWIYVIIHLFRSKECKITGVNSNVLKVGTLGDNDMSLWFMDYKKYTTLVEYVDIGEAVDTG